MAVDPLTAGIELGTMLIGKIWPNPADQANALFKLEELKQKGDLAELSGYLTTLTGQLEINKVEAAHPSIWVAGWRPFIGWVCGLGLLYVSLIEPLARFIATMNGYEGTFPVIDTTITMQVLLGMLGLGAQRSWDKSKGVDTSGLSKKLGR
jgi:hypothetical protein